MNHLMPALFVGHGSPMNALGNNLYAKTLRELGETLPRPKSILMISAHWQTEGTCLLDVENPEMIYDFSGFPPELSLIQYPALGSPDLAKRIMSLVSFSQVKLTSQWGFDHGAWAVLKHLYPQADIPVLPLSLNRGWSLREHYSFAQNLKELRKQGILVLASGNITHNLRQILWEEDASPFSWAQEFDMAIRDAISQWDIETLLGGNKISPTLWKMAHPTLEHYIPLLYVMAVAEKGEQISFAHELIQNGSMSMRNVLIS